MLVVEKYLDVLGGHEVTQINAIQTLIGDQAMTIITGRQCQLFEHGASKVFPVLSSRSDIETSPESSVEWDKKAMIDILSSKWFPQQKSILYGTAQTHDIQVGLRLLHSAPPSKTIYMRVLREREIAQLSERERTALKAAIEAERIILMTETETLSSHFLARYRLRCHETVLCLPCSVFPSNLVNTRSLNDSEERTYRVGLLGGDRPEKGRELFPQFVRQLRYALNCELHDNKVELLLQKRTKKRKLKHVPEYVKREYALLRGIGWPGCNKRISLNFQPINLSKASFLETLMSIDVLLLPYSLDAYRHRGSGIVLDGVAARIPIVYTDGMGMTEFLRHGNAEAALEDPKDYALQVVNVLANIEAYRKGADRALIELETRIESTATFLRSI